MTTDNVTGLDPALIDWLLDSDPALRWQVERDLLDAPDEVWQATRARTASEGFGARLLALQDADGQWAGGAYFPARADDRAINPPPDTPDNRAQPWTATTWSLNALREWGVPASALGDTAERLARNSRWEYDDLPYWGGEVDCCINGYTLANGTWLGADVEALAAWFPEHQLDDGGWNCEWENGATRSSFHSTINSLDGLLYREQHAPHAATTPALRTARHAAEAYLLERRLMFRLSDGRRVADWVDNFAHPARWPYTVLRAAEHFRRATELDGVDPDERLADAIEVIRGKQQSDGRWLLDVWHPGQEWFRVDVAPGEASPWLTMQALRVLRWWDAAH